MDIRNAETAGKWRGVADELDLVGLTAQARGLRLAAEELAGPEPRLRVACPDCARLLAEMQARMQEAEQYRDERNAAEARAAEAARILRDELTIMGSMADELRLLRPIAEVAARDGMFDRPALIAAREWGAKFGGPAK